MLVFRAPALSCTHYFQAPATQATPTVNWIWRTLPFLYPCESAVKINSLGVKTVEHWSRTVYSPILFSRGSNSAIVQGHTFRIDVWLPKRRSQWKDVSLPTNSDRVSTEHCIRVFECSITVTCSTLKKVLQVSVRRSLLTALNFRILSTDVIQWKLF